jgi:histidine phosphotransferase ChpT
MPVISPEKQMLTLPHLDLLLSKLFHDLISPVAAAKNGLELVREFGDEDVGGDAMDLVNQSVLQAADRLTFFRMAFGGAGSGGALNARLAVELAAAYLNGRKVEAEFAGWPSDGAPDGVMKVLMGVVALGVDCLPRGGIVRVAAPGAGSGAGCVVTAEGQGAGLAPHVRAQLQDGGEPDAETILAELIRLNAARFGVTLSVEGEAGISLTW